MERSGPSEADRLEVPNWSGWLSLMPGRQVIVLAWSWCRPISMDHRRAGSTSARSTVRPAITSRSDSSQNGSTN